MIVEQVPSVLRSVQNGAMTFSPLGNVSDEYDILGELKLSIPLLLICCSVKKHGLASIHHIVTIIVHTAVTVLLYNDMYMQIQ